MAALHTLCFLWLAMVTMAPSDCSENGRPGAEPLAIMGVEIVETIV